MRLPNLFKRPWLGQEIADDRARRKAIDDWFDANTGPTSPEPEPSRPKTWWEEGFEREERREERSRRLWDDVGAVVGIVVSVFGSALLLSSLHSCGH